MQAKHQAIYGRSIQVDPTFPYYRGRSAASVAEEIRLAGYEIVHYFVVNERHVNRELIDAFQSCGIRVWAMVLGNGTFQVDGYPAQWPSWQMGMLKPVNDGYTRLSPFSEGYRKWKKTAVAELVYRYPFDGFEIAEPYFPEWDGIRRGVYGDVGPLAEEAFRVYCGCDMPEFADPGSPRYYKRIPDVYERWVSFRVEAVNGFVDELVNGSGGARSARPDIAVATWSLAVRGGKRSVALLRELQGLEASSMIAKAKPDVHYLQTHWPDWTRGDLPSDYIRDYAPFVQGIRETHPTLPLGVQADIGSARNMIKSGSWWRTMQETAQRLGYKTSTAYEYHIGGYMYKERPKPMKAVRTEWNEIVISFNKRIDEASCRPPERVFRFRRENGDSVPVTVEAVRTDGNRVVLRSADYPDTDLVVELAGAIRDTPSLWLFKDKAANTSEVGMKVTVQQG